MKIISIWNPKGGQGKSPLAINLAAAAHFKGKKALIICRDEQGTSVLYHRKGNLPFDVLTAYPKTKQSDTDFIFLDHSADDWTIPKSPIVVIPTKPERPSYASFLRALKRLQDPETASHIKHVIQVVTDTDYHIEDQIEVATTMKRAGAFEIRRSAALFAKAGKEYRTFFDTKIRRVSGVYPRRKDMLKILDAIEKINTTTRIKPATQQEKELAYA